MASKHERRSRRRATLTVEALEARIAPVIVTEGAPYTFPDSNGDSVEVSLFGPGQADVQDIGGLDPWNTDIDSIMLTGTRGRTRLVIADLSAAGGNDVTGGTIQFANPANAQMGTLELNGGPALTPYATFQNTTFLGGKLRVLNVTSVATINCSFQIGPTRVQGIAMVGDLANTQVAVAGSLRTMDTLGSMGSCSVLVTRNAGMLVIGGSVMGGSTITVGQNAGGVAIYSSLDNSLLTVGGHARRVLIGDVVNGATCTVGGNAGWMAVVNNVDNNAAVHVNGNARAILIMNNLMNNSTCTVNGNAGEIIIANNVDNNAAVHVNGNARGIGVGNNLTNNSTCIVGGNVGLMFIGNNFDASGVLVVGRARLFGVVNNMSGAATCTIRRNAQEVRIGNLTGANTVMEVLGGVGHLTIMNNIDSGALCWISGNAGEIRIGNDMNDGMLVVGGAREINVSGSCQNNSNIVVGRVSTLTIGNTLGNSTITVLGSAKFISIGGAINVSVVGFNVMNVVGVLSHLEVGGDVGAAGLINVPGITVGGLRRADVGGVIYGQIHVLGRLGDIWSAGWDASGPFPSPPGGTPPYNGCFAFRDSGGAVTAGYVEYVTWGGKIVS